MDPMFQDIKTQTVAAMPELINLDNLLRQQSELLERHGLSLLPEDITVGLRGIQTLLQAIRRIEANDHQ